MPYFNHIWRSMFLMLLFLFSILLILSSSSKCSWEWWFACYNSMYLLHIWHFTWLSISIRGCLCKGRGCRISSSEASALSTTSSSPSSWSGRGDWSLPSELASTASIACGILNSDNDFPHNICYRPSFNILIFYQASKV